MTETSSYLKNAGSLKYQVDLLENSIEDGTDISARRVYNAFQIMTELIPQMGVFKRLFELIYKELSEAVFSDEMSSTLDHNVDQQAKQHSVHNSVHVQKQPYFVLYRNLLRSRDDKAESLQLYVDSLQESLVEKEKTIESCRDEISQLTDKVDRLSSENFDLRQKVVDLSETINKLDSNFKEFVAQKDISDLHYEEEIINLQNDLNSTSVELERVEKFEAVYKDLDADFTAEEMQVSKMPAQIVPASNKNSVLVDLKSCQALERQLLTVQNSLIEEFDVFLENYRDRMENVTLAKNFRDPNYDKDEKMLTEIDKELADKQNVFKRTIEDVESELEMLRIHRENLEVNRDRIKQEEEEKARDLALKANSDKKSKPTAATKVGSDAAELTPAQKIALETIFDKLEAQEQITSKYSSIIYFSNNKGKTFYELPQNSLCNSCGTTTMICPHKIAKRDWVIDLPANTQMLRISRPKLKLQKKLDEREIEALFSKQLQQAAAQNNKTQQPPQQNAQNDEEKEKEGENIASATQAEGEEEAISNKGSAAPSRESKKSSNGGGELGNGGMSEADIEELKDDALYFSRIPDIQEGLATITEKLPGQFETIWKDYRQRTEGFLRLIPRHMNEERVLSLVEQFLSSVLWQDRSLDLENLPTVVDSLYGFFKDRFLMPKMSYYTLFDFLNSLQYFAKTNIVLLLFVQCLSGDLDWVRLRSLVYIGQLIKQLEWNSIDDLYWFIHVTLPFLPGEECDNLVLDYVAFSKNNLSAELVMHFFYYITLKQKDPRSSNSEIVLCQYPSKEPGVMTEMEYGIAVNDIIPMHSISLRNRLFRQAMKAEATRNHHMNVGGENTASKDVVNGEGVVRFETLVHITAYLQVIDEFETAKKKFTEGDRNDREAEYPKGLKIKSVPSKNPIICSESLLKMASNFSQRERSRAMRQLQQLGQ